MLEIRKKSSKFLHFEILLGFLDQVPLDFNYAANTGMKIPFSWGAVYEG